MKGEKGKGGGRGDGDGGRKVRKENLNLLFKHTLPPLFSLPPSSLPSPPYHSIRQNLQQSQPLHHLIPHSHPSYLISIQRQTSRCSNPSQPRFLFDLNPFLNLNGKSLLVSKNAIGTRITIQAQLHFFKTWGKHTSQSTRPQAQFPNSCSHLPHKQQAQPPSANPRPNLISSPRSWLRVFRSRVCENV